MTNDLINTEYFNNYKKAFYLLRDYRKERMIKISDQFKNRKIMLLEEYMEYLSANSIFQKLDALTDIMVVLINTGFGYKSNEKLEQVYLELIEKEVNLYNKIKSSIKLSRDLHNFMYNGLVHYTIEHPYKFEREIYYRNSGLGAFINCAKLILVHGYDPSLCLLETIKHISCRHQDPKQCKEWNKNGPSGKWKKDPCQDPKTIYKPNWAKCRLK